MSNSIRGKPFLYKIQIFIMYFENVHFSTLSYRVRRLPQIKSLHISLKIAYSYFEKEKITNQVTFRGWGQKLLEIILWIVRKSHTTYSRSVIKTNELVMICHWTIINNFKKWCWCLVWYVWHRILIWNCSFCRVLGRKRIVCCSRLTPTVIRGRQQFSKITSTSLTKTRVSGSGRYIYYDRHCGQNNCESK